MSALPPIGDQRDSWDSGTSGTSGTAGTLGQARENTAIAPRSRKNVSLIWIASRKRLNGQSRCGQSGWLRPGRQAVPSPSAAPLTVAASSREAQVAGPISALRLKDHGRARHERADDRHHLEQCRGKQQPVGWVERQRNPSSAGSMGFAFGSTHPTSSVAQLRLPKCKIQPLRQIRQLPVSDVPTCPVVPLSRLSRCPACPACPVCPAVPAQTTSDQSSPPPLSRRSTADLDRPVRSEICRMVRPCWWSSRKISPSSDLISDSAHWLPINCASKGSASGP
jgi:hypothetical protein